jgi:hypothetical protein
MAVFKEEVSPEKFSENCEKNIKELYQIHKDLTQI